METRKIPVLDCCPRVSHARRVLRPSSNLMLLLTLVIAAAIVVTILWRVDQNAPRERIGFQDADFPLSMPASGDPDHRFQTPSAWQIARIPTAFRYGPLAKASVSPVIHAGCTGPASMLPAFISCQNSAKVVTVVVSGIAPSGDMTAPRTDNPPRIIVAIPTHTPAMMRSVLGLRRTNHMATRPTMK